MFFMTLYLASMSSGNRTKCPGVRPQRRGEGEEGVEAWEQGSMGAGKQGAGI
ncbi:MAG: hypothetical protein RRA32_03630 [bacterium]|nr:hypothetical protein [bacterium]